MGIKEEFVVKNQRQRSYILWGNWAVQKRNMIVDLWCLGSEEGFG